MAHKFFNGALVFFGICRVVCSATFAGLCALGIAALFYHLDEVTAFFMASILSPLFLIFAYMAVDCAVETWEVWEEWE